MICYIDDIRINIVIDELTANNKKNVVKLNMRLTGTFFTLSG